MRTIIPFNDGWLYAPEDLDTRASDSRFQPVTLPHTNVTLPYHNFDNAEYGFISTYRKRFTMPEPASGRRVFGDHEGGYVPFTFDLTDHLHRGENVIQVRLDSTERPDIPPNGYVVDY